MLRSTDGDQCQSRDIYKVNVSVIGGIGAFYVEISTSDSFALIVPADQILTQAALTSCVSYKKLKFALQSIQTRLCLLLFFFFYNSQKIMQKYDNTPPTTLKELNPPCQNEELLPASLTESQIPREANSSKKLLKEKFGIRETIVINYRFF